MKQSTKTEDDDSKSESGISVNNVSDHSESLESSGKQEIENDMKQSKSDDILLFGSDFQKPLEESIDLSSDQDSTGGEDEGDFLGKHFIAFDHLPVKYYNLQVTYYNLPVKYYNILVKYYKLPVKYYDLPVKYYTLPGK